MMKRFVLLAAGIFLLLPMVRACDICGCGAGSYYIGLLPGFNKKIIGLRYRYNTLRTHVGAGGQETYLTTAEIYRTAELWGGWNIGKKIRVMGYVPVNFNSKENQGATTDKKGIGDIGFQGFYRVIDERKTLTKQLLVHSLWVGAGIKIPTGKYDAGEKNISDNNANIFQLGSGSVDITLNAMYDVRLQDVGINATVSYKINTANSEGYRYGNKLSGNVQAYHKLRVKQEITVSPNLGLLYENTARDKARGYLHDMPGGQLLLGAAGMEAGFRRFAIGGSYQLPLSQDLARGSVKANDRAMVHLSILF